MNGVNQRAVDTARLINPLPLSIKITTNDRLKMLSQAQELAGLGSNINVKITINWPEGELHNLEILC